MSESGARKVQAAGTPLLLYSFTYWLVAARRVRVEVVRVGQYSPAAVLLHLLSVVAVETVAGLLVIILLLEATDILIPGAAGTRCAGAPAGVAAVAQIVDSHQATSV